MDFVNVQNQLRNAFGDIDKSTAQYKFLDTFEQQTALPRSYAIIGGAGIYLFLVFMNLCGIGELLSNIAGFVYPCYRSMQALRTKQTEDDTRLLTYWVVFSFLNVAEFWTGAILYWVPAYFFFKTLFLIYLASPSTNGATLVYNQAIKPIADRLFDANGNPTSDLVNQVQTKLE